MTLNTPPTVAEQERRRLARRVLSVADAVATLLDSLPDGDLPAETASLVDELTISAMDLMVHGKRIEQGIVEPVGSKREPGRIGKSKAHARRFIREARS